jgi:ABC-type Fe3+-siderophore transport system permease subunit
MRPLKLILKILSCLIMVAIICAFPAFILVFGIGHARGGARVLLFLLGIALPVLIITLLGWAMFTKRPAKNQK